MSTRNHTVECVEVTGGGELHHELERLVQDWYGMDASVQGASLPKLVDRLAALAMAYPKAVRAACHDQSEAA